VALAATLVVSQPIYFTQEQIDRLAPMPSDVAVASAEVEVGTVETPEGVLNYSRVYRQMWATSYDSTCLGCSDTTATGMKQGFGVVAVDPNLIPLFSQLYIPGYGMAVAGDVGGAIKGNKIDLGFDSLEGQWSAHYVDVYLISETSN